MDLSGMFSLIGGFAIGLVIGFITRKIIQKRGSNKINIYQIQGGFINENKV